MIKEFLVGLGFGVDDSSLAKFNKAIASAALRVGALYASIKVLSAGIFWSIAKISEGFEQMGYEYRIIAPAINKTLVLRREMLKAYQAAGVNITKAIQASVKFNMSLAKTQMVFKALAGSVASKFFPMLTKQMDIFRGKIYANMPKILASLQKFIAFVFKAFEATTILGARVWSILQRIYDFFVMLDKATNGWSTIILGVVAAWKYLNLAFLATPLGMIIAGITALIALYDDFMVWKEGGESLINWGSETTRMIVGIVAAVGALAAGVYAVVAAMRAWAVVQTLINILLTANPIGLIIVGVTALIALLTTLAIKLGYLKGVGSFFSNMGGAVMNLVGGGDSAANGVQNGAKLGQGQPLGTNIANQQQTNQNVNQQTHISVMGAADAQQTGKAVADQQGRVNFDMVRNLTGATR